jgi:hypothetical protein
VPPIAIVPPYPETEKKTTANKITGVVGSFIGDYQMTYQGCLSWVVAMVKIMPVRGIGIPDISTVLKISITKVLKVHNPGNYAIRPKRTHYECLEIDGFWTYVGKKKNKVWLIYDWVVIYKV